MRAKLHLTSQHDNWHDARMPRQYKHKSRTWQNVRERVHSRNGKLMAPSVPVATFGASRSASGGGAQRNDFGRFENVAYRYVLASYVLLLAWCHPVAMRVNILSPVINECAIVASRQYGLGIVSRRISVYLRVGGTDTQYMPVMVTMSGDHPDTEITDPSESPMRACRNDTRDS